MRWHYYEISVINEANPVLVGSSSIAIAESDENRKIFCSHRDRAAMTRPTETCEVYRPCYRGEMPCARIAEIVSLNRVNEAFFEISPILHLLPVLSVLVESPAVQNIWLTFFFLPLPEISCFNENAFFGAIFPFSGTQPRFFCMSFLGRTLRRKKGGNFWRNKQISHFFIAQKEQKDALALIQPRSADPISPMKICSVIKSLVTARCSWNSIFLQLIHRDHDRWTQP